MAVLASELMVKAGILLQDIDNTRWPLAELAGWINDAVRAIVLAKPNAASKSIVLDLAVGTLQKVPVSGNPLPLALLRVIRNLASSSDLNRTAGRSVRMTARDLLDSQQPNWHDGTVTPFKKEVRNVIFDEMNPLEFYVYPGNDGTGFLEAVISYCPAAVALAEGDEASDIESWEQDIGLPEPFSVPVLDYILYRAQLKDDTFANTERATVHYQQFANAIGIKVQNTRSYSPNAPKAAPAPEGSA